MFQIRIKKWNSSLKLVIFDCDGTLIDSQHAIVAAIGDAFTSLDMETPSRSDVMAIIGLSLPAAFARLAPDAGVEKQSTLAGRYKSAYTQRRKAGQPEEALYPGISNIIATLSAQDDVALAIATGKSRIGVDRLLVREGWEADFASIQTADTHPSKPNPSMIFHAMQETGADPASTVMIGDTTFDMDMARAAEVAALGVSWGYHPTSELHRAGAHHVSQTTDTLIEDLNGLIAVGGRVVG